MERLTENYRGCNQIKDCGNAKCEETCKEVENCDSCPISKAIDKLAEYEQAEEDGLLIRVLCNAGDIIYRPLKSKGILEFQIVKIEIYEDEMIYIDDGDNVLEINDFGKTVFLTKAEAEQALAKMKGV